MFNHLDLNPYQFTVYEYLQYATVCKKNTSYKAIAERCKISKNKAIAVVNELVEMEILVKKTKTNEFGGSVMNEYITKYLPSHVVRAMKEERNN